MADYAIGDRVAELRRRKGMTQEELAEAAELAVGVIRKIEQGGTARMESYHTIARALGVRTMVFVPPSTTAPEPVEAQERRDIVLADLRSALVPPIGADGPIYQQHLDEGEPDLHRLQQAVRSVAAAYRSDHYDFVAETTPGLIRSAHYHVDAVPDQQRHDAIHLRGDLLGLAGRYLIQVRAHDLALFAIRDALQDATEVQDQPLVASLIASQAWIMLRQARFAEVEQLCASFAQKIEPRMSDASPEALSAWGFIPLRASSAAARNNQPAEAREYLSAASAAGARLEREQTDLPGQWPFGPLTVAVMGAQNELIAGRPDNALTRSEQLPRDVGATHPDTWNRHLLDQARAQVQTGQLDDATETMTRLRRHSGNWLRHQRLGVQIARDLLGAKKRMPTQEQRDLADFLRVEV